MLLNKAQKLVGRFARDYDVLYNKGNLMKYNDPTKKWSLQELARRVRRRLSVMERQQFFPNGVVDRKFLHFVAQTFTITTYK